MIVSDLENVTKLAKEKSDLAAQEEQTRKAELFADAARRARMLSMLVARLETFAAALKSKFRVEVSSNGIEARISFGFASEWLMHPRVILKITPDYFAEKYSIVAVYPEYYLQQSEIDLDKVTSIVTETAAQVIANANSTPERILPVWYSTMGKIASWPVGLGVWALTMFAGGFWGFFFGWIPALIFAALTKYLWLIGLGVLLTQL
jgi:hypothetical protein